jgi:hypothetical protein
MFELNLFRAFMNRFKFILSRRWVGILLTVLSVFAINAWQQALPNFGWDNSFSLAAAKNISGGHGYAITMASSADFSKSYYEPLNKWPPGYSWLLLLIQKLTGTNWIHAAYLLNGLSLTAFVLLFRKMLFQLEFPAWLVNIAVFCFGFIPHGFETIHYSDIVAIPIFMLGCSLLLKYIKSGGPPGIRIIIPACCFAFCAGLKYLYILPAFVPLSLLIVYAIVRKKKKIKQQAAAGSLLIFLLIGFLLFYQQYHSGNAVFVHPAESGFFPGQLLEAAPFIPASFINISFYDLQIFKYALVPVSTMEDFWKILHAICFIGVLFIIWNFYEKRRLFQENVRTFYFYLASGISFAFYFLLSFLTIRLNKHYPDMEWVYIQELRYYAPISFMLQQFAVFLFLEPRKFFGKYGAYLFRLILVLIMLGEVFHATYFLVKQIIIKREYGQAIVQDLRYWKAVQMTKQQLSAGNPVVVCSNSLIFTNICSLYGSSSLNDLHMLDKKMNSSRPITLITIINSEEQPIIQSFISGTNTKLEYQNGKLLYFITHFP